MIKASLGGTQMAISNWLIGGVAVIGAAIGYSVAEVGPQHVLVAQSAELTGRSTVIDGDTVEIRGERVRFNGIDAPESRQLCKDRAGRDYRCGAVAADALSKFVAASSPLSCKFIARDQYGRFVGNCLRADGESVAKWLVRNGHALDWPRYSQGAYAAEQQIAQLAKTGIWAGSFQNPWDWRAEHRDTPTKAPAAPLMPSDASSNCSIKGNISSRGERIYHMPGQEHYDQTRISERQGERWFCSEEEAQSAGWRRARR